MFNYFLELIWVVIAVFHPIAMLKTVKECYHDWNPFSIAPKCENCDPIGAYIANGKGPKQYQ